MVVVDDSSNNNNNSVDRVALDHPPREALLAAVAAVVEPVDHAAVVGPEVLSRPKAAVAPMTTRKIPVSEARVDPVVLWTVGGDGNPVRAGAGVDRVAALPPVAP